MAMLSQSPAAKASLYLIIVGVLTDVWSGVWYAWLYTLDQTNVDRSWWFLCTGLFLSGLSLFIIGMTLGQIGRAARHAELPPPEATEAAKDGERNNPNPGTAPMGQPQAGGMPQIIVVPQTPGTPAAPGTPAVPPPARR